MAEKILLVSSTSSLLLEGLHSLLQEGSQTRIDLLVGQDFTRCIPPEVHTVYRLDGGTFRPSNLGSDLKRRIEEQDYDVLAALYGDFNDLSYLNVERTILSLPANKYVALAPTKKGLGTQPVTHFGYYTRTLKTPFILLYENAKVIIVFLMLSPYLLVLKGLTWVKDGLVTERR